MQLFFSLTPWLAGIAVYALCMLLAAGNSVWFDEGYSIMLAQADWGQLFALTAVDAHPPLYYALLKIWISILGDSEFAMRSLSAVFAGGTVSIVLVLIRRFFGARAMVYAVPFLLLAPFFLRYGYEIRMYALASLIGMAGTYALLRASVEPRQHARRWWALYIVLVAAGMYTLYLVAAVWIAHVVWLAWRSIRIHAPWRWLYTYIAAGLLFAPYLPTFIYQFTHSALPGIGSEVTLTTLVNIMTYLYMYLAEWNIGGVASLILLAVLVASAACMHAAYTRMEARQRTVYACIVALVFVPIAFFALTSLPPREPIFVLRYIAHISIFFYLALAIAFAAHRGRRFAAWASVSVLVLGFGVYNLWQAGNHIVERGQTPMTRELRAEIDCTNAVIVADDEYTYIDARYYFDDCDFRFAADEPVAKSGGYAPLHDAPERIHTDTVPGDNIIHLHWGGGETRYTVPEGYVIVDEHTYDRQHVSVYRAE